MYKTFFTRMLETVLKRVRVGKLIFQFLPFIDKERHSRGSRIGLSKRAIRLM